jgi:hypothetical protein
MIVWIYSFFSKVRRVSKDLRTRLPVKKYTLAIKGGKPELYNPATKKLEEDYHINDEMMVWLVLFHEYDVPDGEYAVEFDPNIWQFRFI